MDADARQRLFGVSHAFDEPVVQWMAVGLGALLLAAPLAFIILQKTGKTDPKLRQDLWARYKSWLIFIPLMAGPILLGGAWVIAASGLLGIFCYREFARATGLFRNWVISITVVLGILALTFAELDNWYNFFVALMPLTIAIMAAAAVLEDQPQGYIQRLALGIFAFMLFGVCFGHLGFFANHLPYRPVLCWLIASAELNDIFAYIAGKSLGRRKIAPNTSPNKTLGGALGALLLTTVFAATLGHWVFKDTPVDRPIHLITLGLIISVAGQFGDLTLSSIKRDLGIKDWANTFPGHGGLLDRFNSLLLVAPATFHYLVYMRGLGIDQPKRILTRGLSTMDEWKYDPARDLGMSQKERLRSLRRESGLVGMMTRNLWWWFVRGYFRLGQNIVVEGRDNLPVAPPFILVANHASHFDAVVMACALPLRQRNHVFPVAAGDTFFETPVITAFAAGMMNALPLWRKNAGRHAMEQLRKRLVEEPCGYILFPEGTRTRTGEMGKFRSGIGMLIAAAPVPVLPCHLSGTFDALPPKRKLPRRARIRLRIGKPLTFADTPNDREGWNHIARTLEDAVRSLAAHD